MAPFNIMTYGILTCSPTFIRVPWFRSHEEYL